MAATSRRAKRWLAFAAILAALVFLRFRDAPEAAPGVEVAADGAAAVERAWEERRSGVMVEIDGRVERALSDDDEGSRHQRFIVRLETGRTLLVAHNIDLARRVPVAVGDPVTIRGQYEWNERGGVLHWTHADPDGERRDGGWIRHDGQLYE